MQHVVAIWIHIHTSATSVYNYRVAVHTYIHTYLSFQETEIGVADGGEEHPHADLQATRRRHLHLLHHQRLAGRPRHRRCTYIPYIPDCSCFHGRYGAVAGARRRKTYEWGGRRKTSRCRATYSIFMHIPLQLMGFPWVEEAPFAKLLLPLAAMVSSIDIDG